MYFYFYKITNCINQKFYYGVHKTDNLDDGYMGSGIAIHKAYQKYGIDNFKKEILMFFESEQKMYEYEELIVNDSMVKNKDCYNMVTGGRNKKTIYKLTELASSSNKSKDYENQKNGIKKYWSTGNIEEKKKKQSEANKKYWTTGNVEEKRKRHSVSQIKSYQNNPERKKKISDKNKEFWASEKGEKTKIERTMRNKENKKMIEYYSKMKEKQAGYNNFDFQKRWKQIYDENSDIICKFLIETDLPESFIFDFIFHKNVKPVNAIKYYQHIGKLPSAIKTETKNRFLKMKNSGNGHKDGSFKKTYFAEPKKKIMFVFNDFFEQFDYIRKEFLNDMNVSDSDVIQGRLSNKYKNFKQVIEYFSEIGVIFNKRVVNIKKEKTVNGKTFLFTTTKTMFDVDFTKKQTTLLDKELNEYEYNSSNDDGKLVLKGRFRL